jgi:hypothetical protein
MRLKLKRTLLHELNSPSECIDLVSVGQN